MKNKVLIFKNDRTGDLFVSLKAINRIINKHNNQDVFIFLSNINHKFSFLFPKLKNKIISMNLNIFEKIKIFFYILFNKVDTIYILTPKNFYYYLPFFFRNIKFYAITIKSLKSRPSSFLIKYLFKYVVLNRINIKKRQSSYLIQENLVEFTSDKNNLNKEFKILNNFFLNKYNSFDFDQYESKIINRQNIIFLKNIDGYDLFDAINRSSKIISPEGIMTHMGYFLQKPILALMHFKLNNRRDFINQIISCKEWFPPNNYDYTVLKNDFNRSLQKLTKRI